MMLSLCHNRRSIANLFAFLLLITTGCRPASDTPTDIAAPPPNVDAETRLRDVFRRYQVTSYYEDDAEVILHAPGASSAASKETETAPLSVSYAPHELTVAAYTARIRVVVAPDPAGQDRERVDLLAWFDEPQTSHFDAQVLRRGWQASVAERLPLPRILEDEVLGSRLSAGLAGPPPQLEWLLADQPMQKLFTPQTEFSWLPPATINDVELQRILVMSQSERFVFWIDANTSLIHRVELPLRELGGSAARIDRSDWSLRLELRSATFQPSAAGRAAPPPIPPRQPKLVRSFVPLPPPPPSQLIGRTISLQPVKQVAAGDAGPHTTASEYLIIALPPADPADLLPWIQTWIQATGVLVSPQFQNTHVMIVSTNRDVRNSMRELPTSVFTIADPRGVDGLIRQLRMDAGAVTLLRRLPHGDDVGQILLTEKVTNPSTLSNAIAVIRDSQSGVDIAARMEQDYDAILHSYNAKLRQHRMNE